MSCCSGISGKGFEPVDLMDIQKRETFLHSGHEEKNGHTRYAMSLPGIHCGACIAAIERAVAPLPGIVKARVNLTLKRINLELDETGDVLTAVDAIEALGFEINPIDMGDLEELGHDRQSSNLLKALAVAGFATMNIMLLSVSVWSGAENSTRDLFHIISAFIAVPVVVYSGQVFFRSALGALKVGRLNMDVPISLAVLLALGMSIFETVRGGAEAYFDAATMLLFFLLIGRYLDQKMRDKVRNSVVALSKLAAKGANVVLDDGNVNFVAIDEVHPGMRLRIYTGDRFPVDGTVVNGATDVDCSIVTGESAPVSVGLNDEVEAGTLNLTGAVDIKVVKAADQSFLAEVMKMLEAAETGRGHYVRIADRMARIYAPAVHLLALCAFIWWMVTTAGDWHTSLMIAIAVLIVTCPCALGLAVPVVHVVAASRLMNQGVLMRDGSALERLAEVNRVIFDKTGTLTIGTPQVTDLFGIDDGQLPLLKALALQSSHPASRAVVHFLHYVDPVTLTDVVEFPGFGVQAQHNGTELRLGRSSWVSEIVSKQPNAQIEGLGFGRDGSKLGTVMLAEQIRPGAIETLDVLGKLKIGAEMLSGDGKSAVTALADKLGIADYRFGQTPKGKLEHVRASTGNVLMVGDGINDAPALAAGHVSMAPATAADVGRQAADFILTRDGLAAVPFSIDVAVRADRIIKQNFGLALIYNAIAVPLAFSGFITPLFAAIAMSASSIVVVLNSMRLNIGDSVETMSPEREEKASGSLEEAAA